MSYYAEQLEELVVEISLESGVYFCSHEEDLKWREENAERLATGHFKDPNKIGPQNLELWERVLWNSGQRDSFFSPAAIEELEFLIQHDMIDL